MGHRYIDYLPEFGLQKTPDFPTVTHVYLLLTHILITKILIQLQNFKIIYNF